MATRTFVREAFYASEQDCQALNEFVQRLGYSEAAVAELRVGSHNGRIQVTVERLEGAERDLS